LRQQFGFFAHVFSIQAVSATSVPMAVDTDTYYATTPAAWQHGAGQDYSKRLSNHVHHIRTNINHHFRVLI
jgi:alpha-ketoglutarate-dependent taurine dioxygenase